MLGSVRFGPVTGRQIATAIMLLTLVFKKVEIPSDKSLKYYVIFLISFAFTSLFSNNLDSYFHDLLGFYLVAFIAYISTRQVVNENHLSLVIFLFIGIGVINSIFTILQFNGNDYAFYVSDLFKVISDVNIDSYDVYINNSLPGLFGQVMNGYFCLITTIISYYVIFRYKYFLRFIPCALCFIASFLCQQRAPFYINIAILVFFVFKVFKEVSVYKKFKFFVLFFIFIAIVIPNIIDFTSESQMRYSELGKDLTGRNLIFNDNISYLGNHIFTANIYEYMNIYNGMPHILPFNMFIYAGFCGGLVLVIMLIKHVLSIFDCVRIKLNNSNIAHVLFSLALLGHILNSSSHNESFVAGSALYWILYACIKGKS